MPKLEISMLNGVAVIAKTYIHTHTHTYCLIPKKKIFAVIDSVNIVLLKKKNCAELAKDDRTENQIKL